MSHAILFRWGFLSVIDVILFGNIIRYIDKKSGCITACLRPILRSLTAHLIKIVKIMSDGKKCMGLKFVLEHDCARIVDIILKLHCFFDGLVP